MLRKNIIQIILGSREITSSSKVREVQSAEGYIVLQNLMEADSDDKYRRDLHLWIVGRKKFICYRVEI